MSTSECIADPARSCHLDVGSHGPREIHDHPVSGPAPDATGDQAGAAIVRDPGIRGGVPTLAGTRIPASIIAGLLLDGLRADEIAGLYPSVTAAHIAALEGREVSS